MSVHYANRFFSKERKKEKENDGKKLRFSDVVDEEKFKILSGWRLNWDPPLT